MAAISKKFIRAPQLLKKLKKKVDQIEKCFK